jgi:hypothetical protein
LSGKPRQGGRKRGAERNEEKTWQMRRVALLDCEV